MTITPQAQALSAGCDLWVCPAYSDSTRWTAVLDWQLNFSLSKFEVHEPAVLSSPLQHILNQTGLPTKSFKIAHAPTLVPAQAQLPTKWILYFQAEAELTKKFARELLERAGQLNVSSIRVFLPSHWSLEMVQKLDLSSNFSFVSA